MQIPDLLIERSRLLKKITCWKLALFTLLAAFVYMFYSQIQKPLSSKLQQSSYIASIKIENEIYEDTKFDKFLDEIAEDNAIKAVIVQINSPGGTSGAAEKIYNKLLKIKKTRPVVATIGTVGASGAYLIALAADKIYTLNMSLTGSIGVIVQMPELVDLANKIGIKFKNYKSSDLKGLPNPMEYSSPEADAALMAVVKDSYDYFIDLVVLNRKINKEEAKKIADGRIYSGRQAVSLKLVDAIGTVDDAIVWLKTEKKLNNNLQLQEIEPKKHNAFFDILINKLDESSKSFMQKISSKLMSIYK